VKRWLALALVSGGCDIVFNADRLDDPRCKADDEDCDLQPNVTDICPADADTEADDLDRDTVGNACDPDRNVVGDRITLFDPFLDNSRGWNAQQGAWSIVDGAWRTDVVGDARLELVLDSGARPSVRAVFDELVTENNGRAGIYGVQSGSYLTCMVAVSTTGQRFVRIEGFLLGMERELTGSGPIYIQGGQLRDGSLYCRAHHGDDPDVQVTSAPIGAVQLDRFGLIASSASASFQSVMLLDVP